MPDPTPGPWFVRHRPTDDGLAVIEDGRLDGLFPITCEWGEAHLVKAAPDLRDAARAAHYLLSDIGQGQFVDTARFVETLDALTVALARASGDLE